MFMQINRARSVKKHLSSGPDVDLHRAPLRTFLQRNWVNYIPLKRPTKPKAVLWDSDLVPEEPVPQECCKPELTRAPKPWVPSIPYLFHPQSQEDAVVGHWQKENEEKKTPLTEWMSLAASFRGSGSGLACKSRPLTICRIGCAGKQKGWVYIAALKLRQPTVKAS